jgi:hypothetical protein
MGKHNIDNLGPDEFEKMSQGILQKVIGPGLRVYGMGKDGSREATFSGKADYPSTAERWDGKWIFQAKYHDVPQIGPKEARRQLVADLDDELSKIVEKYAHPCDNYILMTNVSLTPAFQVGIKDRIDREIIPKYTNSIKHIHVWGAEEIERFLDGNRDIATQYVGLLSPGDIIAHLMNMLDGQVQDRDENVRLYCQGCFDHEQYAALDDAGDVEDKRVALQRVFVDLTVSPPKLPVSRRDGHPIPDWYKQATGDEERSSALSYLLDDSVQNLVLIGGPGEGKSTLGQYLAQIHRARLIGTLATLADDVAPLDSCLPRIPFRILLREYAQWTATNQSANSLFHYIAGLMTREAGRSIKAEDVQKIMKGNALLLILDGLDEVADKERRKTVVDNIFSAVNQIRQILKCSLKVVATTRPFGYSEEFDPFHFIHVTLTKLSPDHAKSYAVRWAAAREPIPQEAERILKTFDGCLSDRVVSVLTATPLQVTIVLVIIRARGAPPKQREELFESYMDIIYRREQKKHASLVRTDKDLIYGIHKYLAYVLHRRAGKDKTGALVDLDDFRRIIAEYLSHANPLSGSPELENTVEQIAKEASERLVLIESPREGKVGFGLTVIREFFAAGHMVDTAKDSMEVVQRFKAIAKPAHWRNVALFFVGRIARTRPGEASALIDVCREIDTGPVDRLLKRGAELVMQIIEDRALRESYSEIGALQYGLTVLERAGPDHDRSNIERVRGLPDPYQAKVVRPYLEEKLRTGAPDRLRLWTRIYAQILTPDDKWNRAVRQLAKSHDVANRTLALAGAFEHGAHDKWVVNLLNSLAKDNLLLECEETLFLQLHHIGGFLESDLSPEGRAALGIAVWQWLEIEDIDSDEDSDHKLTESEVYLGNPNARSEKTWLFCCATIIVNAVYSHAENFRVADVRRDVRIPPIALAVPSVRQLIARHSATLNRFLDVFKNESEVVSRAYCSLVGYLVNPADQQAYIALVETLRNKKLPSVVRRAASWLFGWDFPASSKPELLFQEAAKLSALYQSDQDYRKDLQELTSLFARQNKSQKSKQGSIDLFLWADFDEDLRDRLDKRFFGRLKDWFGKRGLTLASLEFFRPAGTRCGFDVASEAMSVIETKLASGQPAEELAGGKTLITYDWSDNDEKLSTLRERVLACIRRLVEDESLRELLRPSEVAALLWSALKAGGIGRTGFRDCSTLARSLPEFAHFTWRASALSTRRWDEYTHYLIDGEDGLRQLAGFLLGARVHVWARRHANIPTVSKPARDALWALVRDRGDEWRPKYVTALAMCRLDWVSRGKEYLKTMKQGGEELAGAWAAVLRVNRVSARREREALLAFLVGLLDVPAEFAQGIIQAAYARLGEVAGELEPTDFAEHTLNLPLPRRSKLVRM